MRQWRFSLDSIWKVAKFIGMNTNVRNDERKLAVLSSVTQRENRLLRNVYGYMTAGLAVTALVSFLTCSSPSLLRFFLGNPVAALVVFIAQIGLVIFLSSRIEQMKRSSAIIAFFGYSALMGISLSSIFIVYTGTVIYQAFFTAALMFLGVSVWGSFTKCNLRAWSSYLVMGLWGLIIASLLNIFFGSSTMDFLISLVGVVLFLGLTAFDTRKVVEMNREYGSEMTADEFTKLGIISALNLYLDFLNIFMYLLRLYSHSSRD